MTHLDSGAAAAPLRSQQVDRLLAWAAGASDPRVVVGDFNMRPEEPDMLRLFASFRDAWIEALRNGRATGSGLASRLSIPFRSSA